MLEIAGLTPEFEPVLALARDLHSDTRNAMVVGALRRRVGELLSASGLLEGKIDVFHGRLIAARGDTDWIKKFSHDIREVDASTREEVCPILENLKDIVRRRSDQDEVRKLVEEAIKSLDQTLGLLRNLREAAARAAIEGNAAQDKKVLRARPVKGEVDWAELSREHIARYPKIRARLAE